MKRILQFIGAFVLGAFLITSCNKDDGPQFDPVQQFELEKPIIEKYVKANYPNMVYSSDTTGIWFEIIAPGTADSYTYKVVDTVNNYGYQTKMVRPPLVTARYMGKLISNNTIFDSNIEANDPLVIKLDRLIAAWQIAFQPKSIGAEKIGGLTPKGLQVGSKIRFVTPSYFAYGNTGQGSIPSNAPLYFEIDVLDLK